MIIKQRYESKELLMLRSLNSRMDLNDNEAQHYQNLEKGFAGEKKFDKILEDLTENWIILNDLLFETNNTIFQIDTLLLTGGNVYTFEVKNYEGDFYIQQDKWYTTSNTEIKNPLLQLQRSETLLRRLLQELGFNCPVLSYLVFINHGFHLYNAPINLPAVFPAQLSRFLEKLKKDNLNSKTRQVKLAERLQSISLKESPFTRIPEYTFAKLEKGITCTSCFSFLSPLNKNILICKNCGCRENIDLAILRSIKEYNLLFPNMLVTANTIHDWCKIIDSKKTTRRILSREFELVGYGKSSHYLRENNIDYGLGKELLV